MQFYYRGTNSASGRQVKGTIEAETREKAMELLRQRSLASIVLEAVPGQGTAGKLQAVEAAPGARPQMDSSRGPRRDDLLRSALQANPIQGGKTDDNFGLSFSAAKTAVAAEPTAAKTHGKSKPSSDWVPFASVPNPVSALRERRLKEAGVTLVGAGLVYFAILAMASRPVAPPPPLNRFVPKYELHHIVLSGNLTVPSGLMLARTRMQLECEELRCIAFGDGQKLFPDKSGHFRFDVPIKPNQHPSQVRLYVLLQGSRNLTLSSIPLSEESGKFTANLGNLQLEPQ